MVSSSGSDLDRWRSASSLAGLGLVGVVALAWVDFFGDVRGRDALSWMDPEQHYQLAHAMVRGEGLAGFEIPTALPVFVAPFVAWDGSVASALGVNGLALLLLAAALHGLVRELRLATPSPVVVLLVVSSPLWLGLTRTLYAEPLLTAVVAGTMLFWLRWLRTARPRDGVGFAAGVGLGFAVKMTFPLFFALPVAAALFERVAARRDREAAAVVLACVLPVAGIVGLQAAFLPGALGYYASLGNTAIPVMARIGPLEPASLASLGFYPGDVARHLLFLLTPALGVAMLWSARRAWRARNRLLAGRGLSTPRAALWLWLVGPPLLLVLQAVKEPRHILPCVVPAVLLCVQALDALRRPGLRVGLTTLAVVAALVQWWAVSTHRVVAPYGLDRPLALSALERAVGRAAEPSLRQSRPASLAALRWRHGHDFALVGFDPNEALALSWWAFPGVVYDLATTDGPRLAPVLLDGLPFEDPYLTAVLDTYNRRSGWRRYGAPLGREEVLANADFVLERVAAGRPAGSFPGRTRVASVPREDDVVHVHRRDGPGEPLRARAARGHLARHPKLSPGERHVVAHELLVTAALAGDAGAVRALLAEFPALRGGAAPPRNLYWIGGYPDLQALARRRVAALRAPPPE